MSSNTFHLTVASVGETLFDGQVASGTFPGSAGEFTILANHAPLVTTLKSGVITVRPSVATGEVDNTRKFTIESGILECSHNRAVVLL